MLTTVHKIGQGRENAKLYLKEHPDVMAEIETAKSASITASRADVVETAGGSPERRKAAEEASENFLTERQKNDCDRNRGLRKRKSEGLSGRTARLCAYTEGELSGCHIEKDAGASGGGLP